MKFTNELEQCLDELRRLEDQLQQALDTDTLTLSFFSDSYDAIARLRQQLYLLEEKQINLLQQHLREEQLRAAGEEAMLREEVRNEQIVYEEPTPEPALQPQPEAATPRPSVDPEETKEPNGACFLGDRISKKIYGDFRKSLSLNDRFRFQRDLFAGNAELMNATLDRLNTFQNKEDSLTFLLQEFHWDWENESALAFKEIIEIRFS